MRSLTLACLLTALTCSMTFAQITQIPATSLVNPQTLDFDTGAPAAGPIGGNDPYFTAFGLCNVAIINNPGVHFVAGDVLSGGTTPLTNALCSVNNTLAIVAPQGAMDNHEAGAGWTFRLAPGTVATQFGATIEDQAGHMITVETYQGGVLQNSLTLTITAGFPNAPLIFEDAGGFDEFRFMNPNATGGWGLDDLVLAGVVGTPSGACPPPPADPFQINQSNCSLDIDGVQSFGQSAAITNVLTNEAATLTLQSALTTPLFEMVISLGPLVPSLATTANNQTLNANIVGALFLNGGAGFLLAPLPGTLVLPLQAPFPLVASAQGITLDPSNADGFSLSQGVQLDVTLCSGSSNFDGLSIGNTLEAGWVNGSAGNMPWTVDDLGTTSTATGPTAAFSGANYLYCETSVAHPSSFAFDTCPIDPTTLSNNTIDFQLSRIGAAIATLEVQIDDGNTGTFVTVPMGTFMGADIGQAQGAVEWTSVSIPLPAIAFPSFSVRFLYSGTTSFTGDLAIDDLVIN